MTSSANHIQETVDHLFRHESGKMMACIGRLLGIQHLNAAEDIVHDSLVQAMHTWPYSGIPQNPAAWLYKVARNKSLDYIRRQQRWHCLAAAYAKQQTKDILPVPAFDTIFHADSINDSMLRMLFACCHPAIPPAAQIAFSLKTLCGLSAAEIGRAFLTTEATIAKRIYRAKEKLRQENIDLETLLEEDVVTRLDAVLHCLYLLFNEGYNSCHSQTLIKEDLCAEAMRLLYLLTENKATALPRTYALLALFCFQASRLPARLKENGIVLLEMQDRTAWHQPLIKKGFYFLDKSAMTFYISPYHLQAGIASLHASAPSFAATDWKSIYSLYNILDVRYPDPVVALQKSIAAIYALNPEEALGQLLKINGLENYYLYHSAIGEVYLLLQQKEKAAAAFDKAMALTPSLQEKELLQSKKLKVV